MRSGEPVPHKCWEPAWRSWWRGKKFYASAITDGENDIDALTSSVEKISTVSDVGG